MAKIIEYKVWKHKLTGARASVTGAAPAYGKALDSWEMVTEGFTIAWSDGTRGCGRVPFETREEAEAYALRSPRFLAETPMASY